MSRNSSRECRSVRPGRQRIFAICLGVALCAGANVCLAQNNSPGITQPKAFPPFDASAPGCSPPQHLERVLVFAQDNERQFMQGPRAGWPQRHATAI